MPDSTPEPVRTTPAAVPRDAATVLLLRDRASAGDAADSTAGAGTRPGGLEVFLLQRVPEMAFAAGMTVFPGGSVDSRDLDVEIGWVGPPPAAWTQRLSAPEPLARALVCAAVRETFEESGVLLAGSSGAEVCGVDEPEWEAERAALESRELAFAELLARRGLLLRADLLRPWSHWVTPAGEPRRYDTRFFLAAMPPGQVTRDVTGEADAVAWVRPSDALDQVRRGERAMMPPTAVTLEEIAGFDTVAEVLAAAERRVIAPIQPRLAGRVDDQLRVVLPDGREFLLGEPR